MFLLIFQAVLTILANANKVLSCDRAAYPYAKISFNTSSKGRDVVSPCQVIQPYQKRTLASVNFVNLAIQVTYEKHFTSHTTRQKINKLFNDEHIWLHQYQPFFEAAGDFMVTVVSIC